MWRQLIPLVRLARDSGWRVEIETSGTVQFTELAAEVDHVVVSPKLANSHLPRARRIVDSVLKELATLAHVTWKFVIVDESDMAEVDGLVREFRLADVMLMPEATTPESVISGVRALVPLAASRGYRVSTRLHVLLWGNMRGY